MGFFSSISDTIHTGLDVAGMVPAIGEVADLANAGFYAIQGDTLNAGISLAACIPIGGQLATGGRLAVKAGKEVLETGAKKVLKKEAKEILEKEVKKEVLEEAEEAAAKNIGTKVTKGGKSKTYERPSGYRKEVREKVWENAKNGPDGQVYDPLTGQEMKFDEPWDMGHKPGYEFQKHQQSAADRGIDRSQFLNEHNNPEHYRPELPSSNRSHAGENKTGDYFGD
jgi:predicted ribonuclease toxin of YeeF-YezG toxin-antitoxin module